MRHNHIYLAGSLVAKRTVPFSGTPITITYQHTDALGSPVAETNEAGAVIRRERLTAYGEPADGTYQNGPGFTGHPTDAATKLSYMQQRYYDPVVGRFISVDPVAASPTSGANFNRYWYGNNNPYRFVDPDGRASLNGFSPDDTVMNESGTDHEFSAAESLLRRTTDAFNIPGTFTHGSHGNLRTTSEGFGEGTQELYNASATLARFRGADLGVGQDVFSLACRFGYSESGKQSVAQYIANKNKSNSVYGADGWTSFARDGDSVDITVWAGRNRTGRRGAFQQFRSGGNGPVSGAEISRIRVNLSNNTATFYGATAPVGTRIKPREQIKVQIKQEVP